MYGFFGRAALLLGVLLLLVANRAIAGSPPSPPVATSLPQPTPTPLPGGCPPLLYEGFENGTLGAFLSSGPNSWGLYDYLPWAGRFTARAYYLSNPPPPPPLALAPPPGQPLVDAYLTLRDPMLIPAAASQATLTFWQEGAGIRGGMQVQISTDGGTTWLTLGSWGNESNWVREAFDLGPYRGHALLLRFDALSLPDPAYYDWSIDEVIITAPVGGCATVTPTVTATPTVTPLPSPTTHAGRFQDVPPNHIFYEYVECLGGRGLISGYPCGGPGEPCGAGDKPYYRPASSVTRAQVAKLVATAAGWLDPIPASRQTFEDVPRATLFTFWVHVERLAMRGLISGYPCGTNPFEPCVAPNNRPYFRPNTSLTRGQLAKIDAGAAGYTETPTGQTFADILPGSTFYLYVERVASRSIVGGYPCGGVGEPCQPPANRPYYRSGNTVTRGQAAKIVSSTFFPGCQDLTPTPTPPPTVTATPSPSSASPSATGTPTGLGPTGTATPTGATATATTTPTFRRR